MSNTTTDLIASAKRRASIPTAQNLFGTADFLALAQDELDTGIVPLIMSVKEEYFVAEYDATLVADTANYSIPTRAIGGKLRDVQTVDGDDITSLARLEPENVTSTADGQEGFYLRGNNVVVVPTPSETGTLRLVHFRRPGRLVATSACGQIASINTGSNQVTVTTIPSTFNTNVVVDMIRGTAGFEYRAIDQTITGVSGTTITFGLLPTGLAVGDWIALAEESPIPQIPLELHPVLAQRLAVRCLLSQGKNAKAEQEKLLEMEHAVLGLMTSRVDGEPRKIVSDGLLNHFRRGW